MVTNLLNLTTLAMVGLAEAELIIANGGSLSKATLKWFALLCPVLVGAFVRIDVCAVIPARQGFDMHISFEVAE